MTFSTFRGQQKNLCLPRKRWGPCAPCTGGGAKHPSIVALNHAKLVGAQFESTLNRPQKCEHIATHKPAVQQTTHTHTHRSTIPSPTADNHIVNVHWACGSSERKQVGITITASMFERRFPEQVLHCITSYRWSSEPTKQTST